MEPIVLELRAYTSDETETEPLPVSSLAFSSPEIFESQWFPKVLTLIFLLATVPTGYSLWWVYKGGTSNNSVSELIVVGLSIQLVTHAFVLVVFTALCLYFHFNSLPPLWVLSIRYHRFDGKKKIIIQQCLWGLWVGFMTAGLFAFNYFCINYLVFNLDIWRGIWKSNPLGYALDETLVK